MIEMLSFKLIFFRYGFNNIKEHEKNNLFIVEGLGLVQMGRQSLKKSIILFFKAFWTLFYYWKQYFVYVENYSKFATLFYSK